MGKKSRRQMPVQSISKPTTYRSEQENMNGSREASLRSQSNPQSLITNSTKVSSSFQQRFDEQQRERLKGVDGWDAIAVYEWAKAHRSSFIRAIAHTLKEHGVNGSKLRRLDSLEGEIQLHVFGIPSRQISQTRRLIHKLFDGNG